MNRLITMTAIGAVIACGSTGAGYAADRTFNTKGDMTDEEVARLMNLREQYDDLFESLYKLDKKLGNAILTSSLGLVLDAGALGTGIATDVRRAKEDAKAAAELDKLSADKLKEEFEKAFLADCESDKKKNPEKYKEEAKEDIHEGEKIKEKEVTCDEMLARFGGSEERAEDTREVSREAMMQYLAGKSGGADSESQIMNWVRMGAAAGGTITSIASAGLISSAEKDVGELETKLNAFEAGLDSVKNIAMQARVEGRKNNPMKEIGDCWPSKYKLDVIRKNLKKAKILPIVGAVTSGLGAAASGVGNAKAVAEKKGLAKGLSIGATAASGVGAAMNGVSIGVVASNRKQIRANIDALASCEEYLWWDDNGHAFETATDAQGTGLGTYECEPGSRLMLTTPFYEDDRCLVCLDYENPAVDAWDEPGKTCVVRSCKTGYILAKSSMILQSDSKEFNSCYQKCTIPNGKSVQFWNDTSHYYYMPRTERGRDHPSNNDGKWAECGTLLSLDIGDNFTICEPGFKKVRGTDFANSMECVEEKK
jgi:hypothetical protein